MSRKLELRKVERGPERLQPGDLAGLAKLGVKAGCTSVPSYVTVPADLN